MSKGAFVAAMGGFVNLDASDNRERPVDRLAALGAAQIARAEEAEQEAILASLGVDLIRYKFAGVDCEADAQDQLAGILAWARWWKPYPAPEARDLDVVATWAVHEWRHDKCPSRPDGCGGAGEVPSAAKPLDGPQPMMACPKCGGTKLRRWTDEERVQAMARTFDREMSRAHSIISLAESLAMRRAEEQIERWR